MDRNELLNLFTNKYGIEVGGPSNIFKADGAFPVYTRIKRLDGCNFSTHTLWEKEIQEGGAYVFNASKDAGYQHICEACALGYKVGLNRYDFVISSNCLEHIANPLKALMEFKRVLVDRGLLLLILPKKETNFDHNRPVTSFIHIHNDFVDKIDESDLTHLDEIINLHDLSLDPLAGTLEQFSVRSLNNYNNRALHHHIFDMTLLSNMLVEIDMDEIYSEETATDYIIVGRK